MANRHLPMRQAQAQGTRFWLDFLPSRQEPALGLDEFRYPLTDMADDSADQRFKANQNRLPVHLQGPFEGLKRQEAKLKELLSTQDGQEAFLKDPVAAMEAAGVEIDPGLRKALRSGQAKRNSLRGTETALFANGSSVTPKVRVRITF